MFVPYLAYSAVMFTGISTVMISHNSKLAGVNVAFSVQMQALSAVGAEASKSQVPATDDSV